MSAGMRKGAEIYSAWMVSGEGKGRSFEFNAGVSDALQAAGSSCDDVFRPAVSPYKAGTCQHDAWLAGVAEGRRLWRINGCSHG